MIFPLARPDGLVPATQSALTGSGLCNTNSWSLTTVPVPRELRVRTGHAGLDRPASVPIGKQSGMGAMERLVQPLFCATTL